MGSTEKINSSHEYVHFWNKCHHCGQVPIIGARYECQSCPAGPDIDLCESCYRGYLAGNVSHPSIGFGLSTETQEHVFKKIHGAAVTNIEELLKSFEITDSKPEIPEKFVVRPEFHYRNQSSFGGHGFVIKHGVNRYCLSALHVMDEVIKQTKTNVHISNREYTGKELPSLVSKVTLYDVMQDKWMFYELGDCNDMLVMPNARLGEEEPVSFRDICAFKVSSHADVNPGRLAARSPKVGDTVWVMARDSDNDNKRQAVVVVSDDTSLIFRYTKQCELAKYTSGAPILSDQGEVVAINIGATTYSGFRFGHGNPVGNIFQHLQEASELQTVSQ